MSRNHTKLGIKLNTDSSLTILGLLALYIYTLFALYAVPESLQWGTDALFFERWVVESREFGTGPFDLSVISPVQGLGGLTPPLDGWIHPGFVPGTVLGDWVSPDLANNFAMIFGFSMATYALGRMWGLSNCLAVCAAQLAGILCFPPISLHLGLCDMYSITAPAIALPVITGTFLVAVFLGLGTDRRSINVACMLGMPAIVIYSVLCDPLYTAVGMIAPGFLLLGGLVASSSRRQFYWRIGGLGFCTAVCLVANLLTMYWAYSHYSARSAFPNEIHGGVQIFGTGSAWLFQPILGPRTIAILVLLACVATLLRGSRGEKSISLSILAFQVVIVGVSLIYIFGGVRWSYPVPDYFEQAMVPAYFVMLVIGGRFIVSYRWANVIERWRGNRNTIAILMCVLPLVATIALLVVTLLESCEVIQRTNPPPPLNTKPGPITQKLVDEIGLAENNNFRGSLVTVLGVPGGAMGDWLRITDDHPSSQQDRFFRFAPNAPRSEESYYDAVSYVRGTFDEHLWFQDLWTLGIPTLEHNSQLVTIPRYFLFSRALARKTDYQFTNYSLVSVVRPKLMAALGARFLLTDLELPEDSTYAEADSYANLHGITLRLYEFTAPNTGGYSPTKLIIKETAREMIDTMLGSEFSFERQVVVDRAISDVAELQPADSCQMFFERGGVRVKANSLGTSLVVLPLEYSHSLTVTSNNNSPSPKLIRANVIQTGVLFSGEIDIKLKHEFGPFKSCSGRLKDIAECEALEMIETGEIPFPPDRMPYARQ